MSDSSRVEVVIGRQVDKLTPATDGELMFRTGGGGDEPMQEASSNAVRADLQETGSTITNISSTYQMDTEYVIGQNRLHFENVVKRVFPTSATVLSAVGGDISFVATGNKITSTTANKFNAIVLGIPYWVKGSNIAANHGWMVFTAKTTGATPFLTVDSSWTTLQDDTPSGTAVSLTMAPGGTNGVTTELYNTIEENFSDLISGNYDLYTGMKGEKLSITVPLPGIITMSVNYVGLGGISGNDTSQFSGTVVDVSTNPIMNGGKNIFDIREAGVKDKYEFGSLQVDINSGARPRGKLGSLHNTRIGTNRFAVSGSIDIYNDEQAFEIREKAKASVPTSLSFVLKDDLGNQDIWMLPFVKFLSGQRQSGQNDQFVSMKPTWKATRHPTFGYTVGMWSLPVSMA